MSSRRYCVVTPCRDEAPFATRTLDSVVGQSEPPALWVIVDDGSRDATPEILARYCERYPFIRVVRCADRGDRKLGSGVIDAFYRGYETVDSSAFEYVCKLDLDLVLPPRYFELLMNRMEAEPRLGTCSGKAYFLADGTTEAPVPFPLEEGGRVVSEKIGDENSVGASKFYRTRCFRQIGGFVREVMWDGIDGHRCRQLGWIAASWDDPELRFLHLRPMGSSHRSWWTGRVRWGAGQYFMGTTPWYLAASALYRMTRPPLVIGGLAILHGYLRSMLEARPRYGDDAFRAFLARYQRACLLVGKRRATARLDAESAARWNADDASAAPAPAPALALARESARPEARGRGARVPAHAGAWTGEAGRGHDAGRRG